ncbi:MAG: AI-2E family transporter [Deltaproteobacteria bacterium]|jgi:predicted PurR-regulated permease PerM|nr:AI-2E family transporter [Deltaproteobacteria bacterium]
MSDRDKLPRWVLWLSLTIASAWLLYTLRGVLAPVFFAFLIAYMLDPLVDRIEQSRLLRNRGYGRAVGIAVILAGFFAISVIGVLIIVPMVYEEVANFLKRLPQMVARSRAEWEPILAEYGVAIPTSVGQAFEELHLDVQSVVAKGYAPFVAAMRSFLGGTASAVAGIVASVMIPVFAFYLLYDFDRLIAAARELIPPRRRDDADGFFGEIDAVLGQFFRGQFTVMAILGVLYAAGYGAIGVPLALPIGILAGVLAFIPYVGSFTALGLALLMTMLDWQGWTQLIWVLGVHAVIQGLESFVITPKIMGDTVGISAIAVLLALLVGAELLGFTGVLLAVPAAAVLKILFQRVVTRYRGSSFYGEAADPVPSNDPPAD